MKPGDRLLLAYPGCGTCRRCSEGHPCFCTVITNKHLNGDKGVFHTVVAAAEDDADYDTKSNSESVYGSFHGQSSFANYTIVKEGAVVNAEGLVENEEELKLFAPVVCGFQTGAGSIMSVARGRKEDSVVVTGLGGVGLGAILVSWFFFLACLRFVGELGLLGIIFLFLECLPSSKACHFRKQRAFLSVVTSFLALSLATFVNVDADYFLTIPSG